MKTSQITHVLESEGLLLDYGLLTNPHPLNVGSAATLTLVVSVPLATGTVNVAQFIIKFPLGGDPADLCTAAPTGCSIASSAHDRWSIAASATVPGLFIVTPPDEKPIAMRAESLTIMFTGITIDTPVGTAQLKILEWAAEDPAPAPPLEKPPTGTATIAVAKFPAGFFAGNFAPTAPAVHRDGCATFNWIGSPGTYKIYSGLNPPVDVSNVRTWTSASLGDTTSFLLEASAQGGSQSTFLYFTATVTVINPSIVATTLEVKATSQLDGAVTATGGVTADALTLTRSLTLAGAAAKLLAPSQGLGGPGTYVANTDGFMVGNVLTPAESDYDEICVLRLSVPGGAFVYATGGNLQSRLNDHPVGNLSSATLPVQAGSTCILSIAHFPDHDRVRARTATWWVPLGTAPLGGETLTKISDEVPEAYRACLPKPLVSTRRTSSPRLRGVNLAFLWMFIRSLRRA